MKGIQKLPSTYKGNFIKYLNRPHFSLDILSNFSDHQIIMLFLLLPLFFFNNLMDKHMPLLYSFHLYQLLFFFFLELTQLNTLQLVLFSFFPSSSSSLFFLIENDKIKERKYKFHTQYTLGSKKGKKICVQVILQCGEAWMIWAYEKKKLQVFYWLKVGYQGSMMERIA